MWWRRVRKQKANNIENTNKCYCGLSKLFSFALPISVINSIKLSRSLSVSLALPAFVCKPMHTLKMKYNNHVVSEALFACVFRKRTISNSIEQQWFCQNVFYIESFGSEVLLFLLNVCGKYFCSKDCW